MAQTILISAELYNLDTQARYGVRRHFRSTTGSNDDGAVMTVDTSEENVTISADIGNCGWAYFRNLAEYSKTFARTIDIGLATGQYFIRLEPGDASIVKLLPTASKLYMVASHTGVQLQYNIFED